MFTIRNEVPDKSNKFYIRKANGGYSNCVAGKPQYTTGSVLANCVGYAAGRFNEIIGSWTYDCLCNNPGRFITDGAKKGLELVSYPVIGGIMVWTKGSSSSGHVAIVEDIYDDGTIYTSESAYNGKTFYNAKRSNSNGRWGISSSYTFKGCIVNPAVGRVTARTDNAYTNFVKDLQSAIGANVDGIAGSETLSKTPTLSTSKNSKHKAVKVVQTYLIALGYSCGSTGADGVYGSNTKKAVKSYQKDQGLSTQDGVITAKMYTWKKLLKLS